MKERLMTRKPVKPFLSLIRMQLNVNYGISALKYRFTREKKNAGNLC